MKKERIETLVDSFIDENGKTHYFVIAAISEVLPNKLEELCPNLSLYGIDQTISVKAYIYDCIGNRSTSLDKLVKGIKIGFSVCNPVDDFDEELGKKIAIGRARKNSKYALYATELGYVNTKLVRAFLEQEAEYFKRNPEARIFNYKRK